VNLAKLRLMGSGYTAEECDLYGLAACRPLDGAADFLSNELNNAVFRPLLNDSAQKHLLEDKWAAQIFMQSLNVPMPPLVGLYHPHFGSTPAGAHLRTVDQVRGALTPLLPCRLIIKPRGGRQGRNIIAAEFRLSEEGDVTVAHEGVQSTLEDFLHGLPVDAFKDYDGGYHGWLFQHFVRQHPFMLELAPFAVNTCRVITFVTASGESKVHLAALRLGRRGSAADNWDKGGLSVHVDPLNGRLGRGVFKPRYGGQWVSAHPDTGVAFEGRAVPMWEEVLGVCRRAAAALSGVRSVGWDVALTAEGPVILEGNADWSLPLVQVHTRGYLTSEVRADLAGQGANFPRRLKSPALALAGHIRRQWRRSRGPRWLGILRWAMPRVGAPP
jgi:hypothetical protein